MQQYNELAKLCGHGTISTPPLSLASSPPQKKDSSTPDLDVIAIIESKQGETGAAAKIRAGVSAAHLLRKSNAQSDGVKIWSGPSADRTEPACSTMPSISESPLEQDFTVEGKPSKLGCPFTAMAGKKLSSHAASVLSRYNARDNASMVPSTPMSSVSRIHGRDTWSRRNSRRASFVDPIKAEICGMCDHNKPAESDDVKGQEDVVPQVEQAEAGVCPIRFLDQHSPEEVATYFEKHKHELPRSHEVCVKRYQSNEAQIRELDAKYGNLVSMIQGLGAKHKDMLPEEPADGDVDAALDGKSHKEIARWASGVSVEAADGHGEVEAAEARQPHFERPMREIRVGESPSRPWGIPVPEKYLDAAASTTSSKPVEGAPALPSQPTQKPVKTCPFGHGTAAAPKPAISDEPRIAQPAFIASEKQVPAAANAQGAEREQPRMTFTGPVLIGFSADDAVKILRESGFGR